MVKTTPLTQNRQTMTSTTKNPERTIWAHQSGHKIGKVIMIVVCETCLHHLAPLMKKTPNKLNRFGLPVQVLPMRNNSTEIHLAFTKKNNFSIGA